MLSLEEVVDPVTLFFVLLCFETCPPFVLSGVIADTCCRYSSDRIPPSLLLSYHHHHPCKDRQQSPRWSSVKVSSKSTWVFDLGGPLHTTDAITAIVHELASEQV